MTADEEYCRLLKHLLTEGERVRTRNASVRRCFDWQCVFTRTPLICLRKVAWKNCLREWEWFMSGSCNLEDLHESCHHWWRPWADANGNVMNNYSVQFRHFEGVSRQVDQIAYLVDGLRDHPNSRRNVITTWNTADMVSDNTPITNCHGTVIQAFVDIKNAIHLKTYQRSVDVVCGLPHNWLQYWAFLTWLAYKTGRDVGSLRWNGGDVHLYDVHEEIAVCMIGLASQGGPELLYHPTQGEFAADDFSLSGEYRPFLSEWVKMVV